MIRNVYDSSRRRNKKARRSRAWLNGVEVTSRCFYADDRRGVVGLYKLNADGNKYVEDARTGEPLAGKMRSARYQPRAAKEWLHGRVRLERAA